MAPHSGIRMDTGDQVLEWLFANPQAKMADLMPFSIRVLREAADLCGVDSVDMTKRQAIVAILNTFF